MESEIREVLAEHGQLPVDLSVLSDRADLYQLGLSSHSSVNVMLALEDKFGIEFPDTMLRKSTFQSVAAIRDALISLGTTAKAI
jgi:acyl carrier protein